MRKILPSLLALLMLTTAAFAEFKENYRQAIEAIEAGRFAEAIPFLRAALQERSEARTMVFGRYRYYLPHYFLGVALAETGDCRAALDAWQTSEDQGKVKKAPEYQDLLGRRRACNEQLERLASALDQASQRFEAAQKTADRVQALSRQEELGSTWRQKFGAQQRKAADLLQQAESALQAGKEQSDLVQLDQAVALASQAQQRFEALAADAGALKVSVREAATNARSEVEEVRTSLRDMLLSIDDLKPFPPRLKRRVDNVEALLEEAEDGLAKASSGSLVDLKERMTVAMSQLRRAARRPPSSLSEGVEAFLRGDFLQALELLEDKSYKDVTAQGHACLIRAAAAFSLFVHGGERDEEQRLDLLEQIRACAEMDDIPQPTSRFFSPRFSDFYRSTLEALVSGDVPVGLEESREPDLEAAPVTGTDAAAER